MKRVSTITFLLGLASLASADVVLPKIIAGHAEEPLIVAHRGASRDAPSNTIPAFQLAWKQGADAIEGDFHLSKDGEIVCFHDADTERVAGTQLVVRQSTLAELKKAGCGRESRSGFQRNKNPDHR